MPQGEAVWGSCSVIWRLLAFGLGTLRRQFFPVFGFRPVFHSIPGRLTRKSRRSCVRTCSSLPPVVRYEVVRSMKEKKKGPLVRLGDSRRVRAISETLFRERQHSETGRIRFRRVRFKPRTQWVFLPSPSSGERTQWVPLSLLFVCQSELTEFCAELTEFCAELTEFAVKLSEAQWVLFSEQYSRNSIPPVS